MSTLTLNLDDDDARLVAQAAQAANQPLEQWLRENICRAAERAVSHAETVATRVSPLHPGAMKPAPDFNAPLEEFAPYV
ncbi:MAG: hypothetical protein HYY23_03470 [Verrucomicrobia bacterium]|nr:hypothetical protein [Verrucomicrobiota bacterium]